MVINQGFMFEPLFISHSAVAHVQFPCVPHAFQDTRPTSTRASIFSEARAGRGARALSEGGSIVNTVVL